jgi:hypothetical protein
MLELMNPMALEMGAARRREIAEETIRSSRIADSGSREAIGPTLGFVGQRGLRARVDSQRVDALSASPKPKMQPTCDCA